MTDRSPFTKPLKDLSNVKVNNKDTFEKDSSLKYDCQDSMKRFCTRTDLLLQSLQRASKELEIQSADFSENVIRNISDQLMKEYPQIQPSPKDDGIPSPCPEENLYEELAQDFENVFFDVTPIEVVTPQPPVEIQTLCLIRPIVFLTFKDDEYLESQLLRLLEKLCSRGLIVVKLRDVSSLKRLDQFMFKEEFRYKAIYSKKAISLQELEHIELLLVHDIESIQEKVYEKCRTFIHFDLPYSFEQYMMELKSVNERCVSFILSQPKRFLEQRTYILRDYIDDQTHEEIQRDFVRNVNGYFGDCNETTTIVNVQNVAQKFDVDESFVSGYFESLTVFGLEILRKLPTQVRLAVLKEDKQGDDLTLVLARCIKKNGRRLISLRRQQKLYDNYQVDLKLLQRYFGLDVDKLCELIKSSYLFMMPEFFDFDLEVRVNPTIPTLSGNFENKERNPITLPNPSRQMEDKISRFERFYQIVLAFQDARFNNDVDLGLQYRFGQFCQDYFSGLQDMRVCESQPLPFKQLVLIKQKTQLLKDIEQIIEFGETSLRGVLQILIGNNTATKWKDIDLSGRYRDHDHRELLPYILEKLNEPDTESRSQGWVMKKVKK